MIKKFKLYGKYTRKQLANEIAFRIEEHTGKYAEVRKVKGIYHVYVRK